MRSRAILPIAVFLLFSAVPAVVDGQEGWQRASAQVTRAELEELLARYEAAAATGGSGRDQARLEATLIRQRLAEGDLRVGDRVMLVVEGHPQLTETFTVVAGRKLELPEIGDVPLEGVLRSELEQHLTTQIGRYIRSPTVRARALVRLEILGAIGSPGFYTVPSDVLVSDALMLAGGPSGNADLERVRITRGRDVLWGGDQLRRAIIEGRTLDQLSVHAGDGIFVPVRRSRYAFLREVLVVTSGVASLIWALRRTGVL
jgi:protein involved in polysaccharide export with SLBB domain